MKQNNLTVPIAIVVAGALVAGALFFAGRAATPSGTTNTQEGAEKNVPAVTADDHILGNPDAPIKVIEYTDFECPFCKQFHVTMQQIMDEYGKDGQVAWVIRDFPLSQLHPNAPKLAEAAECVTELAGKDAFWTFLDNVFEIAPVNVFFPMDRLDEVAVKSGADQQGFDQCLASGKYQDKIEKEFNDAIATGGQGTPHNIIVAGDQVIALPGAQPYATVKQVIDSLLKDQQASQ